MNPMIGPYGRKALDNAEALRANGVNTVWFHGFDAAAFELCAQNGLNACVEFKTFRADFNKHPDLVPIGVDGKPIRYGRLVQGVCLSQQDFLAETEQALLDGVRTYTPPGIWLDYLTYAGWFETPEPDLQESCFCAACVAEFCDATGCEADTPAEILQRHAAAWTRHKCERIAEFGKHYASIIRGALPDCLVGAYMCPWTPDEFDGALTRIFAQDYALLAPAIDVFTPLIYATKSGKPAHWSKVYMQDAERFIPSGKKVQLILDAAEFPDNLQALAGAPDPGWGVQMFAGAEIFADSERAELFRSLVEQIHWRSA